jgi:hypothetical protein
MLFCLKLQSQNGWSVTTTGRDALLLEIAVKIGGASRQQGVMSHEKCRDVLGASR